MHDIVKQVFLLTALLLVVPIAYAQKIFTEGKIVYKLSISPSNGNIFSGTYTYIIKGQQIREEIKLDNGYSDILLLNTLNNTYYSLREQGGKKYAIQLDINDIKDNQKDCKGFTMHEKSNTKNIAGFEAKKAVIEYPDGQDLDIYYTSKWSPPNNLMFTYFPGIKVLPLKYSYKTLKGTIMNFEAQSVSSEPIENATFRIPVDYKIISHKEYEQMQN